MHKRIIIIICMLSSVYINGADLKGYRDTPLLCSKVEENHLPYGEYSIVRSYRNVTQLLISANAKIILYTDRDNQKDSEIYVSAYSPIEEIHLEASPMQQHEFDLAVEKLIKKGDTGVSATYPFTGCDTIIDELQTGLKPEKVDDEYYIYLKRNSRPVSLMTINLLWKKLTLRNIPNEENTPSIFYSIYINESYDKNIKRIIREYFAVLKK